VPKRIFAVLYVSVMGLTRCYKTTVFFTFIIYINGTLKALAVGFTAVNITLGGKKRSASWVGWTEVCSQAHISLIINSFINDFAFIIQFQHKGYLNSWLYFFLSFSFTTGHFCMCVIWKKTYYIPV